MPDQGELLRKLELEFKDELKALRKDTLLRNQKSVITAYDKLTTKFASKNSELNSILKTLKEIQDPEERRIIGSKANKLRQFFLDQITSERAKLLEKILAKQLMSEAIDPTLPGENNEVAHQHIISKTFAEIEDIFAKMGFTVTYANEVDTEYNSFDALNIPAHHPARDSWDTLWLNDGNLMIPQTSAMQNRILKNNELPIRSVILGKTFRNEATDARHEHTFSQCEGVYLDNRASMSDMLGVLLEFFQTFFGRKLKHKFTPDFFPFVEPGGQVAIECVICNSTGKKGDSKCRLCKGTRFLEILGCGMIHPTVITKAGKNPDEVSGFAWGFGVERLAMIKYEINDLRYFYSGDLRFNKQFN